MSEIPCIFPLIREFVHGTLNGEYWYTIGMCRFEPGELDPYLPELIQLPDDHLLIDVTR